ncbi:MAG: RDD family protein [Bryobacteraceae bacterium]
MRESKANALEIRTPEGVTFSLLLAGPVSRFLAFAVDLACMSVIVEVIARLAVAIRVLSPDFSGAMRAILYFVVMLGYAIAFEWQWRGQTPGKRLLRLRVMDAQALKLQPSQIVTRNLLRFVDALPVFYLVGGAACVLSRHAQRLGDLAANTVVVRSPETQPPDLDKILGGKYNSLREHPHLAARLRQKVRPAMASVALQAVTRRDQFDPQARLELFASLVAHFQSVVEFPAETVDQLPGEQYVRNVVEILYVSTIGSFTTGKFTDRAMKQSS